MQLAVEGEDRCLGPSDASVRYNNIGVQRLLGGATTAEEGERPLFAQLFLCLHTGPVLVSLTLSNNAFFRRWACKLEDMSLDPQDPSRTQVWWPIFITSTESQAGLRNRQIPRTCWPPS